MVDVKDVFKIKKVKEISFANPNPSMGILDDYAVRKNLDTIAGTIQKVPVNPKDIVNKAYADSIGGGVDWTIDQGAVNIHPGNYTDTNTTDHTLFTNIGTNTHAQVDTHIALTNAHLDWTIDQGLVNIHAGNYTDTNTTAHASFSQLDYASAAHTGFAPALGLDDNYVTDAEKIVIGNTSGINTGDNAGVTSVTGTAPVASSGGVTPAISMAAATNLAAGHATAAHITAIEANTAKVTNATHTGEVTGSAALTIANDAVTYAKMQNVSATDKVLGRSTAGAGDVEEIACTAAGRALIDDANAAAQLTTLGAMPIAGGTFTGLAEARDHGTAATDEIINVCYGTGDPPVANTTTEGALFVKYTA